MATRVKWRREWINGIATRRPPATAPRSCRSHRSPCAARSMTPRWTLKVTRSAGSPSPSARSTGAEPWDPVEVMRGNGRGSPRHRLHDCCRVPAIAASPDSRNPRIIGGYQRVVPVRAFLGLSCGTRPGVITGWQCGAGPSTSHVSLQARLGFRCWSGGSPSPSLPWWSPSSV